MGFEFYFCEEALKKEKHINNKLLPVIMEVLKFLILVCHVREENLYGFFPSFFFSVQSKIPFSVLLVAMV